jgi:hypothetical protein
VPAPLIALVVARYEVAAAGIPAAVVPTDGAPTRIAELAG